MNNELYNEVLKNFDKKIEKNERLAKALDKTSFAVGGIAACSLFVTICNSTAMSENPVVSAVGFGTAMAGAVINIGAKIAAAVYDSRAQEANAEKFEKILEHSQQVRDEVAEKAGNNILKGVEESDIDEMAIDEFDM